MSLKEANTKFLPAAEAAEMLNKVCERCCREVHIKSMLALQNLLSEETLFFLRHLIEEEHEECTKD
jgi:hypothetical protein